MANTRNIVARLFGTAIFVCFFSILFTFYIEHVEEKTSVFNPVHIFFRDFNFSDVYYKTRALKVPDGHINEIVVVNGMCADRYKIASLINTIKESEPEAIGVDYYFVEPVKTRKDSIQTQELNYTIHNTERLVFGRSLTDKTSIVDISDSVLGRRRMQVNDSISGFINLSDFRSTIRLLPLVDTTSGRLIKSFSLVIAEMHLGHDNPSLRNLLNSSDVLRIEYLPAGSFYTINGDSLLANRASFRKAIKGKIVLLGECDLDSNICGKQDKHFTPLNEQLAGRSFPDMEGVYIHANALNTLLKQQYFFEFPEWLIIVATIAICVFILFFLVIVYCKPHHIFHFFVVLVYEPVVYFLFMGLSVFFYQKGIYIDFKFPFIIFTISPFVIYLIDLLDMFVDFLIRKISHNRFRSPSYFTSCRVDHFTSHK